VTPTPPPIPLSAEFESFVEPKIPGAIAQKSPWKLSRCTSGKSITDYGNKTVITDPQAQQTITLDHLKKQAIITPFPQAPGNLPGSMPALPQMPSLKPPSLQNPEMDVKDLGKRMIAGHEAEGKLYTFKPPKLGVPGLPAMPQPPGVAPPAIPQIPGGMPPQLGSLPSPPKLQPPPLPHTMEVWTSPKLNLPLLTKTGPGLSQQTTACKQVTVGEPPACSAQIPPDYKIIKPPAMPGVISKIIK
jgi:hypothetical protein